MLDYLACAVGVVGVPLLWMFLFWAAVGGPIIALTN